MNYGTKSIRPFIGARDFALSRAFYKEIGFQESIISQTFSYFSIRSFGFYLQDAYVKDWIENTMIFMEVTDVQQVLNDFRELDLPTRYTSVKLSAIRVEEWGSEFFLHDPSGNLWHFGEFSVS